MDLAHVFVDAAAELDEKNQVKCMKYSGLCFVVFLEINWKTQMETETIVRLQGINSEYSIKNLVTDINLKATLVCKYDIINHLLRWSYKCT